MMIADALKAVMEIRKAKDVIDIALSLDCISEMHENLKESRILLEQKEKEIFK